MTRQRLSSGVSGLDAVLNGGFFQSGLYIIQGKPGAGKTILANQICFSHAARGGKAAYVTLLTESIPRMFQNLATMTFFDAGRSPDKIYYVSALDVLESSGLRGLVHLLRGEIKDRQSSLLVLDGIVSAAEKAESGIDFRKFIHELQGYASAFRCTVFLLGTTNSDAVVQVEHTMAEGLIDLVDTSLHTQAQRTLHVRKLRGSSYIGGRHSFTIIEDGVEVFPRIEAAFKAPLSEVDAQEPLPTGIAGLDRLSGVGGLRSSSSTLLAGPVGSGKTTFGAQFLRGCTPAQRGLLFGFYESPAEVLANADAHGSALSELVSAGVLDLHWQSNAENILDELGHQLIRAVANRNVRRVFVDGLNGFISSAVYPERVDRFVAALTIELRRLGATSIFSVESHGGAAPTLPPAAAGLPALYDNVIFLRTLEVGPRIQRLLSVTKMRGCDFDDSIREYGFDRGGLFVGEVFEEGRGAWQPRQRVHPASPTGNDEV